MTRSEQLKQRHNVKFSVIYEFDCGMTTSVKCYLPSQRHLFTTTESKDGEPSDWCSDLFNGKCKHRKLCAMLDKAQFEQFLSDTGLFPESTETMGSLGAPGFDCGWAPAIAFSSDDQEAIQSAYVTPLCAKPNGEPIRPQGATERDWQRVRRAVLSKYR